MTLAIVPTEVRDRALAIEDRVHEFCLRHAVTVLRVALGGVFVLFGALKFFPNLSPAQAVAVMTTQKLTLGLVPAQALLTFVAFVEVGVGLCLVTNRFMRVALWALAFEMFAILSPIVLLTGQLFSGPHHLPSLLGQYILKDVVLLGGVLVLFTMQRNELRPRVRPTEPALPASALNADLPRTPTAPVDHSRPATHRGLAPHPRRVGHTTGGRSRVR